jgi:hypothetical protein
MKSLGKQSRIIGKNVSKSLGKTAGVSTNKMASILFLIITIFIALALSGVAFLVSHKDATSPEVSAGMVLYMKSREGLTDMSGTTMDASGSKMDISGVKM